MDYYTDITNGNDTTGTGASGTPWATIQKAVDSATYGDTIHVANTGINTLSASIKFNTGFTNSGSGFTAWLTFKAWDNGGSRTIDTPSGASVTAFEVDGDNVASEILDYATMPANCRIAVIGMYGRNTTAQVLRMQARYVVKDCRLVNANNETFKDQSYNGLIINSIIENTSSFVVVRIGNSTLYGCHVISGTGWTISVDADHAKILNCIVEVNGARGINIVSGNNAVIANNTIIGDGDSGQYGLYNQDGEIAIFNNMFHSINGASSYGANVGFNSGDATSLIGYNAFYDCTNDYQNATRTIIDETANDITESTDPLTDAAGGDYSIKSDALSVGAGYGNLTIGASQLTSAGGGGGGGGLIFTE